MCRETTILLETHILTYLYKYINIHTYMEHLFADIVWHNPYPNAHSPYSMQLLPVSVPVPVPVNDPVHGSSDKNASACSVAMFRERYLYIFTCIYINICILSQLCFWVRCSSCWLHVIATVIPSFLIHILLYTKSILYTQFYINHLQLLK